MLLLSNKLADNSLYINYLTKKEITTGQKRHIISNHHVEDNDTLLDS